MNSFYNPEYRRGLYVPVVHAYYDRADMMQTTTKAVNHSHALCEIMYVNEGTMSIETPGGTVTVGCDQFIWLDANVWHWNLRFDTSLCSMMNIEFQYEQLDMRAPSLAVIEKFDPAMAEFLANGKPTIMLSDCNGVVYHLMKQIIQLCVSTNPEAEKLCSILCTQVMAEVARLGSFVQASGQPVRNQYVSDALEIMRRDYAESLTAARIASQLHIQPSYLHRLFREHTACTIGEHLQHIRIRHAQELLRDTDWSLLKIANDVGISNQQYFCQLFKRITGVAPTEYRKQAAADGDAPDMN
ncbi:MAG TPA: AraC family transcriptional regulator [Candidatus Limiplasma sp.]|nr:AraC family transcriptional regulator [Candidatus Limiplasma sp.]